MSKKAELKDAPFPSEFASRETKRGWEWLYQYAKAIEMNTQMSNTFYLGGTDFATRFIRNDQYIKGTQPAEIYKPKPSNQEGDPGNDTAKLEIFYDTSNPIGTIVNNVVGALQNQGYRPLVTNMSPESKTKYDKELETFKRKQALAANAENLKAQGLDVSKYIRDVKQVLVSEDEMELHFEMNFKDDVAFCVQTVLDYILKTNKYPELERRALRNIVATGWVVMSVADSKPGNIVIKVEKMQNFRCSNFEHEDGRDIRWAYVSRVVSVNELAIMANNELTEEQLFQAAKTNWPNGQPWPWGDAYNQNQFTGTRPWGTGQAVIMDARLISVNNTKYSYGRNERTSGSKLIEYGEDKKPLKDSETIDVPCEYVYGMKYVFGTDIMFDYGEKPCYWSIGTNGRMSATATLGFHVFAIDIENMTNSSMVDQLIGLADNWVFTKLNIMRMIAQAHPAGAWLNIDAVAGAINGFGEGKVKPKDMLRMFQWKGSGYYSSQINGVPLGDAKPIHEISESTLQSVTVMANTLLDIRSQMEIISGVPFATVGAPDKDSLIGNSEIAAINRNNTLRYIDIAYKSVMQRVCENIITVMQYQLSDGTELIDYGAAIGYETVEVMKITKQIPMIQLGIDIEVAPNAIDQQAVLTPLQKAFELGVLGAGDFVRVFEMIKTSPLRAAKYLDIIERRRVREKEQSDMNKIVANAQENAKAGLVVEKAKMEGAMLASKLKINELHVDYKLKSGQSHQDYMEDMKLLNVEYDRKEDLVEMANEIGGGGYESKNLPKSAGVRLPSVPS